MPIYKKVNKNFFKKWSPEMAYVLGFFMADGYLFTNKRGGKYFAIQIKDKDLLVKIRSAFGSDHKITKRMHNKDKSVFYRMQIGSNEMCKDLENLGISENKTYRLKMPEVPKKYFGDFVRGYFDGDGSVWVGKIHKKRKTQTLAIHIAFTSCSLKFLEDLRNLLSNLGLGKGSIYSRDNAHCLKYSIKDSLNLSKIMYNNLNNDLFLDSKKSKFDEFINRRW